MSPIETFFAAWGETEDAARADMLGRVLSENAAYADPRSDGVLTGPNAITSYVSMFSANAPGWTAKVTKSDEIASLTRVTVAFGGQGPDGKEMVQLGQYFVEMDGEKIARLTGFVGTGS